MADELGGWTCHVHQAAYGHELRKETWLYAVGVELPSLRWGRRGGKVGWSDADRATRQRRAGRVKKSAYLAGRRRSAEASRTPLAFRDVLLSIARSTRSRTEAA